VPQGKGGCTLPLLVGCGVVLVIVGILAVVFVWNAPRFLDWAYGKMGQLVIERLPESIPAEDRERLEEGFAALSRAAAKGRIDPAAARDLQGRIQDLATRDPAQITREDVQELAQALERVAGKGAGEETTAPPAVEPEGS
jgi:hypothetical protein